MPSLVDIIRASQTQLAEITDATAARLVEITADARKELERRLRALAPGASFTRTDLTSKLAQVRAIQLQIAGQLGHATGVAITKAGKLSVKTADRTMQAYMDQSVEQFGVRPVAVETGVGILDPGLVEHYKTSRLRYTSAQITRFRGSLSQSLLQGDTLVQAWERMAADLGFEPYQAERLARTEVSNAGHRRELQHIKRWGPGWRKQLMTLFDNRTHQDSVLIHEQSRDPDEPFERANGEKFQHPPDRPNDRGTMLFLPPDVPAAQIHNDETPEA